MITTRQLTADDLALFELNIDDYEILKGTLLERKTVGGLHGRIGYGVGFSLGLHVIPNSLGRLYTSDTGFVIENDPLSVLRPDVAFVRAERIYPGLEERGFMSIVPDLVVEVLSPGDRSPDIAKKIEEYRRASVAILWVVDPRTHTVTVYTPENEPRTLDEDDELDGGEILPGFRLPVREIFR
jgi:Uma2 family endonuclease